FVKEKVKTTENMMKWIPIVVNWILQGYHVISVDIPGLWTHPSGFKKNEERKLAEQETKFGSKSEEQSHAYAWKRTHMRAEQ
ncbi:hypothetical protein PIB30_088552, partial [Stylosanthes scabra]|nr:hypothetical protein [Stylosanthes scabra]